MGNECKLLSIEDSHSTLNINNDSPKKPKIKELEDIKKRIMSISIFKRAKIAESKYKEYKNNLDNMKEKKDTLNNYIEIRELLFYNDTNKDIVKLYLNFLRENPDFIKNYNLNTYEDEKHKFKKLFTVEEMKHIEQNIKTISEKQHLLNFLEKMAKIANHKEFISYIVTEYNNIYYFNYPIEFFEKELFYYKFYILIIKELYKNRINDKDYFIKRGKVAEFVLNNNILNNPDIINDEDKMNILLILILYDELDEKGESINFNRLLQTKKITFNDLQKYIIDNKIGKIVKTEKSPISTIQFEEKERKELKKYRDKTIERKELEKDQGKTNEGNILTKTYSIKIKINNPNDFCLKNLNNEDLKKSDNIYLLYNLSSLLRKSDLTYFLERIKTFLIKFINSNVYTQAIIELFPKYNKYILGNNLEDMEIFIKERLKFYPYQGLSNSGLTEKFSLYSYIPILFFKITCFDDNLIESLKISAVIENTIHEINHINQDIIYFRGNDEALFNSPKREKYKGKDGGEYLEELLFGQKIERLRILESLYVLNEENYKQNLENFRKNFQNLHKDSSVAFSQKKKYLKINENGIFNDICINIDNYSLEEIKKIELYSICTKSQQNNPFDAEIYFPKKVCKMGE